MTPMNLGPQNFKFFPDPTALVLLTLVFCSNEIVLRSESDLLASVHQESEATDTKNRISRFPR